MLVTEQMLQAGVQKAIELRILLRRRTPSPQASERRLMREILDAAFRVVPEARKEYLSRPLPDKKEEPPNWKND